MIWNKVGSTAVQRQAVVTAYLKKTQLLLLEFAR